MVMERSVPHNIEAEKNILSAMTLSPDACATALQALTSESFYKVEHRELFISVAELYDKNLPADVVSVVENLTRHGKLESAGGAAYVTEIINYSVTAANL